MISIIMTPYQNVEVFQKQYKALKSCIDTDFEVIISVVDTDPMQTWFVDFCSTNDIRCMVVPNFGVINLINILAARARGDYIFYVSDIMVFDESDKWGSLVVNTLQKKDKINSAILSLHTNDYNCTGLFMTTKLFHVLGYYACPVFTSPIVAYRWNASILTDVGRLVNIKCGINYNKVDSDSLLEDMDLFNVTRSARIATSERVKEFVEDDNDRTTANN